MTADTIMEFIGERGAEISTRDLTTLNQMLFELPVEDVSNVRAWAMESIALIINDPLYKGDVPPFE